MIERKSTFFLGIFVFLIPFLGVPSSWKTFFIVVSGLYLIFLSVKIPMPNVAPKKPVKSPRVKKEKAPPGFDNPSTIVVPEMITPKVDSKPKKVDGVQIK